MDSNLKVLTPKAIRHLDDLFADLQNVTVPEESCELHDRLTVTMWGWVKKHITLPKGAEILDIGCGPGTALRMFRDEGYDACGITCNEADYTAADELNGGKGWHVYLRDMHAMGVCTSSMDFVWIRHALEHSPIPFFVLREIKSILRPGGWVYAEVPIEGTCSHHETNPSHWSLFSPIMWEELFRRAGFEIVAATNIDFSLEIGPERYLAYILSAKS
jgi:SAM-dependent methyltransferase